MIYHDKLEKMVVESLAARSKTDAHELIADMIDYYGVQGVNDLNTEQLEEYAKLKKIKV